MEIADLKCRGYYYMASPYSDRSIAKRHEYFLSTLEYQATLIKSGLFIYSPIGSLHDTAVLHQLPTDHKFWLDQNKIFILASAGMIIAKIDGWEDSEGIYQEIQLCRELKKKMFTFDLGRMRVAPYGEAFDA